MMRQQLLLVGAIASLVSISGTVSAQDKVTNQSDTSGQQTFTTPLVQIDDNGNINAGQNTTFDPTITDAGGGLSFGEVQLQIDPNVVNSDLGASIGLPSTPGINTGGANPGGISRRTTTGPGQDPGDNPSGGNVDPIGCQGDICQEGNVGNPKDITINDVAELLEADVSESLKELAAVNDAVLKAEEGPRRIARRQNLGDVRACVNPSIEARKKVEDKLEQTRNFIEEVDRFKPENGLW